MRPILQLAIPTGSAMSSCGRFGLSSDRREAVGGRLRAASGATVSLEMLLPGPPESWGAQSAGEACAAAVLAHLQARGMSEVRAKMAERTRDLRRRAAGAAGAAADEGGNATREEEWHAFRERLRSRRAEPSVQLLGCADVGHAPGRGRRVLSCRLGLDPGSARELGRLAYPQFFVERSSRKRTTAGSSGASGARRASLWRSWSCGSSPSRGRLRGRKATAP
ncbi:unnamed protein product [Prorocentrum cordatum]|uniref:Uncharacterized protein n=1 Tax=Prorocentrum cordatum TaxID=2364126 RepID=A0ABN9QUB6_9DINO|nr:unnamed protein product [Polarella glacialis]